MIKKILSVTLAFIMILSVVIIAPITASAETSEIFKYSVKDGKATITGYTSEPTGDLVIPDTLDGYPVTSVGNYAFECCTGLTGINIPNGIKSINWATFADCSGLKCIVIPKSVTSIDNFAFDACSGLTSVGIPSSVKSIGNCAFRNCTGLKTVYYTGSEADRKKIEISYYNDDLENAKWVYNHKHSYKSTVKKATLTKNGEITYGKCVCGATKTATTIYYPKTIKLSTISYKYDGKVKKPTVKVTGSNGKVITSSNYTVSYSSGRKNIGSYTVTVKFKGNYSGTKKLTFKIVPKNPSVKIKSAKKKATISYKKISGGVKYQIQYSTKKKSGYKNVKTNTTSLKVTKSKLKSKKTYYFRVRAYKKVGSTTYYSGWVTKSVKIK